MAEVFGAKKLVWSIIFFIVQVFNFGFLVGAMNYDLWFHQNWTAYKTPTYQFKGQLLNPQSDLGSLCDNDDTYHECYINCDNYCNRYDTWYSAGSAYIFFDTVGAIASFVIAVIIVLDYIKFRYLKKLLNIYITAFIMIGITIFHLLAFIIWSATVQLRFDGCTHNINYSGSDTVCGEGGAAFALFIVFYLVIVTIPYFIIARKIRIEDLKEGSEPSGDALEPNQDS